MAEEQTKTGTGTEAPMADKATQVRMMRELLPFIMGANTKFTVDENNNINLKTNYAPTQARNLQAQTQATEQAGLPSYGGIDPEMVMQLMGQRGKQDAMMAGQTAQDMSGMYQGALTQQALGAPQRQEQDIRTKLVMQLLANQATTQAARIKNQGSASDQIKNFAFMELYKRDPVAALQGIYPGAKPDAIPNAIQEINFLADKLKIPVERAADEDGTRVTS